MAIHQRSAVHRTCCEQRPPRRHLPSSTSRTMLRPDRPGVRALLECAGHRSCSILSALRRDAHHPTPRSRDAYEERPTTRCRIGMRIAGRSAGRESEMLSRRPGSCHRPTQSDRFAPASSARLARCEHGTSPRRASVIPALRSTELRESLRRVRSLRLVESAPRHGAVARADPARHTRTFATATLGSSRRPGRERHVPTRAANGARRSNGGPARRDPREPRTSKTANRRRQLRRRFTRVHCGLADERTGSGRPRELTECSRRGHRGRGSHVVRPAGEHRW